MLGCAQTGTGKTCAFAAPILQRLSAETVSGRPIRALVLTPTRELAIQIGESFEAYGKYLSLRHAVIFGGVGQNPQVEALRRGVDILVATPGRLMDLHDQGFVSLDELDIFVLDEATSSIDTETEQLIQNAIQTVLTGRTSFIVAHRLSTIRSADKILVIRGGRITEAGTHDELLAKKGVYYRLWNQLPGEDTL